MRLLHVSDWHLGATLGRIRRTEDHEAVLAEMRAVAADVRPHLILHSGDLFDHARPAVEDLQRAVEALRDLSGIAPVVVLAGNHDSPALFEVFDRMLALAGGGPGGRDGVGDGGRGGVRFIGRARPPAKGGVLTFLGEGDEQVRLAPVPFIHPNSFMDRMFDVAPERWTANYVDQVRVVQQALAGGLTTGFDPGRHILLYAAHLHVHGAVLARSERPLHVSEHFATTTEDLPAVTYAAFGHIHKPQALPGLVTGRYAGSPIAIDFGELGEEKSVVLVEAAPGRPPKIEPVPLGGGRPLRRVSGTLDQLAALDDVGRAIVQATVDTDDHVPDLADRLTRLWPRAAFFDVVERSATATVELATEVGPDEAEPDTETLFRQYLAETGTGGAEVDRAMALFAGLHTGVVTGSPATFPEEGLFG